MCETYKCVIMALILTAFGIICFIHDSDNNDSEEFNDIILKIARPTGLPDFRDRVGIISYLSNFKKLFLHQNV